MKEYKLKTTLISALILISCVSHANDISDTVTATLLKKVEQLEQQTGDLLARIRDLEGQLTLGHSRSKSGAVDRASTTSHGRKIKSEEHFTDAKSKPIKAVVSESDTYMQIKKLIERKEYNKAEKLSVNYMTRFPDEKHTSAVQFWLGEIKMLFGDLVQAKDYYQKALEQADSDERTPEILLKLSVICYQTGEIQEGDKHYDQLISKYPQSTALHMAKAQRSKYRIPVQSS